MAVGDLVKQTSVQEAVDTLRKGGVKSKYETLSAAGGLLR